MCIEEMDVMEWAAGYEGEKFHAMICDPPYEIGFMGKAFDKTGISFRSETWAALAEHLLPGAWIFAFASSRGWHRMAVAMEDAGLILQPSIFVNGEVMELPLAFLHVEGQSFPKATKIDTQIDRKAKIKCPECWGSGFVVVSTGDLEHSDMSAYTRETCPVCEGSGWKVGAEREVVGSYRTSMSGPSHPPHGGGPFSDDNYQWKSTVNIEKPATPLAAAWEGHRYGGQVLKNAATPVILAYKPLSQVRPIICAQKPWTNPRLDCIVETGAGALWVDGGRVGTDNRQNPQAGFVRHGRTDEEVFMGTDRNKPDIELPQVKGRWPSNLVLLHSPGCERVGAKRVKGDGNWKGRNVYSQKFSGVVYCKSVTLSNGEQSPVADADGREEVEEWRCVEGCAVRQLGEQSGKTTSTDRIRHNNQSITSDKGIYGKFADKNTTGFSDTGTAARFYYNASWSYEIAERLAMANPVRYQSKAARTERESGLIDHIPCIDCGGIDTEMHIDTQGREVKCRRCGHPTLKPISLIKYLATLLLPPEAYAPRRVLIPFSGVSSEGIGCLLAGWEEIVMIEKEAEYVEIGKSRMRFWQGWKERGHDEVKVILKAAKVEKKSEAKKENEEKQMSLL